MHCRLVLLNALILAFAASAARGTTLDETLMALEQGAMERWRQGDPMGWAEISAPEVTYMDPSLAKPIAGIDAYTRYLNGLKGKIVYQGSEFLHPKVAVYGNVAVMTYQYRSTTNNPDGSVGSRSLWNTTEVYAKVEGQWKIIHSHWSFVDHATPEIVEVPVMVETNPAPYSGVLGELMQLEMGAMERWRTGDPMGFAEISAPAVTYFDSGTPQRIDGLAALKAEYAKRVGKIHYDAMDFLAPTVQVHGDTAVLFYRFFDTYLGRDGSVRNRRAWSCTEVYARAEGVWRIVHTHWSLIHGQPKPARAD